MSRSPSSNDNCQVIPVGYLRSPQVHAGHVRQIYSCGTALLHRLSDTPNINGACAIFKADVAQRSYSCAASTSRRSRTSRWRMGILSTTRVSSRTSQGEALRSFTPPSLPINAIINPRGRNVVRNGLLSEASVSVKTTISRSAKAPAWASSKAICCSNRGSFSLSAKTTTGRDCHKKSFKLSVSATEIASHTVLGSEGVVSCAALGLARKSNAKTNNKGCFIGSPVNPNIGSVQRIAMAEIAPMPEFSKFNRKNMPLLHNLSLDARPLSAWHPEAKKGGTFGRYSTNRCSSHGKYKFSNLFAQQCDSLGGDQRWLMGAVSVAQRHVLWSRPQSGLGGRSATLRACQRQDRTASGAICASGFGLPDRVRRKHSWKNAPQFLVSIALPGSGGTIGTLCGRVRWIGQSDTSQLALPQHILDFRAQLLHPARGLGATRGSHIRDCRINAVLARCDHRPRRCCSQHGDLRQHIRTTRVCAASLVILSVGVSCSTRQDIDMAQSTTYGAAAVEFAIGHRRIATPARKRSRHAMGTVFASRPRRVSRELRRRSVLAARGRGRTGTFIGRPETRKDGISRRAGFREQRTKI